MKKARASSTSSFSSSSSSSSSSPLTYKDHPKAGSTLVRHSRRSFGSSASSLSSTPSPGHSHPLFSSLNSSSSIPFSWEKQPGVPKTPVAPTHRPDTLLPLPPPVRSNSDPFLSVPRRKRADPNVAADPFAVALAECSKDTPAPPPSELDEFWRRGAAAAAARSRPSSSSLTDRFSLVDLYGSCKTSCSVSHSAVLIPRSATRTVAAYARAAQLPARLNRS